MPKSRIPLKNIRQIRLELGRVYRACKDKTMDIDRAKALSLLLKRLADMVISDDLETRIAALESELSKKI